MMSNISICNLLRVLVAAYLLASDQAAAEPSSQPKKGVPFTSDLTKRNLGGQFKDWYLSKFTHNYFCTDRGRLVPVDPGTGHMLLKGLRKRSNWIDDFFGLSHDTEHGLCKNPTWVLPQGWTQPIPKTQFEAQYPWVYVDDRGQIRLKPDFKAWMDQQGAARAAGASSMAYGGQGAVASGGGAMMPGGAPGYTEPLPQYVAPGTGTTSGFGTTTFGNGVVAGSAAHA